MADLPVQVVQNSHWNEGQSTSIITGLSALPENIGSAVFLLADQPQIPVQILTDLIELHNHTLAPVIAPQVHGKRGNPVLFDRQTFSDLMELKGDVGGRAIFEKFGVTWLESGDSRLLLDIDTQEDYQRLIEMDLDEE